MTQPAFDTLLELVHEMHDLGKAAALLSWDREVNMPPRGDSARVAQMTTLRRLTHQRICSDAMGEAIEQAEAAVDGADPAQFEAGLIRILKRDRGRALRLPEDFVIESSQVGARAWRVWREAREADDFERFRPHLERLIDLQRQRADYLGYESEPYDALVDLYEEGMTAAELRQIFSGLREATVPLLEAIEDRGRSLDDGPLHQHFDREAQERFARHIAGVVGYDFERGHLGTATHPFATSFSRDDARITTRWHEDFLSPALFGTLHECGHAIYEQGTGEELARTPLARGCSSGIHESQSRMIENLVGRSLEFWQAHYPDLQAQFPSQFGSLSVEDFHAAINKVQASFIRVEADELTYNLHIILRFELEQAMLSGDLAARDLPIAWKDRFEELLGIRPPDDRLGALQDVHWSGSSFGYFPTYALGNLYAAQLMQAARQDDPAVGRDLARGSTEALLAWLGVKIHRHGRKLPPRELLIQATGRGPDSRAFVAYAEQKFGQLYGL